MTQFKGILNLQNEECGPQMKVLALVKQYEIDNEHLTHHGDEMMKIVYGNKHLTFEQLTNAREKQIRTNLEADPLLKLK